MDSRRGSLTLVVMGIIVLLGFILVWQLYGATKKGYKVPNTLNPSSSSSSPSVTAGNGVPVPLQWQAKAKKLGYYCPSWNKQGGQVSSDVCLKLDN